MFMAMMGCMKSETIEPGLCACSPVELPGVNLVVQNEAGADLLDETAEQFYSKEDINIFGIDRDGKQIDMVFSIRPPFTYKDTKFEYYTIVLPHVYSLKKEFDNKIFIRLGEGDPYELTLIFDGDSGIVKELLIDDEESQQVEEEFAKGSPIFFLTAE